MCGIILLHNNMESIIKFIEWWFVGFPKAVDSRIGKLSLRSYGLEAPFVILVWFVFVLWLFVHPDAASMVGTMLAVIVPFFLPFLLRALFAETRMEYYWLREYNRQEYVVLEIKLPEEINQTPFAMELVLRGLYQTGTAGGTDYHKAIGEMPAWFSLEMVSTEGRVHFYVWTRKQYRSLVENQFYAHYPNVQVVEVPDYTLKVPLDPAVMTMGGIEFTLQKPDPYPILTYVEIGMDKPGTKEEFKHDPMASILEFLGSMKEGENEWIQFIIRAHDTDMACSVAPIDPKTKEPIDPVSLDKWADMEVIAINKKAEVEKEVDGKKTKTQDFFKLTEVDRNQQKAIQNKLNKQLFEVGIRALYIAKKDKSQGTAGIGQASVFRSFEHGAGGRGLNGLRPVFWIGPFIFPWHDFENIRKHMLWERFYDAYVTRQFFYPPHKHSFMVLNSEELATLFHLPGKVAQTPTLQRMPSKRSEAPSNLPI